MRVTSGQIKPPSPGRQIVFHQLLVAARKSWLVDALKDALGAADPNAVKEQILRLVPADVQKILAATGIRDEHVFPVPALLEAKPTSSDTIACFLAFGRRDSTRAEPAWGNSRAWKLADS